MGDRVSIISAGAEWNPGDYNLEGTVINLGVLSLQQTASLYRTCDVGLGMMFTKHPSYLPFEFMASGCMVVSNKNASTKWFLQDGYNCLLTDATPTCIAETIEKALLDTSTRSRIVENAHRMIVEQFSDWDKQMEKIYRFMIDPSNS
jgi:glycosyltransferase involved in cell wall biosynthesis